MNAIFNFAIYISGAPFGPTFPEDIVERVNLEAPKTYFFLEIDQKCSFKK